MQGVWRDGMPAGSAAASLASYAVGVETLTFLFTDIEGSTALLGRLGEDGYEQLLAGHHAVIRSALAAHGGREVDTQGDAFLAVFASPRGCVAAVLAMQQALRGHAWPGGEAVRVRMGIHCWEAARTATGLVGLEVHRAARVAAVAYGGQVLVSEAAAVLVRDGLPPGAALTDLGTYRLKDLGRPERIFQLRAAGLQAEFPPLRSLDNPALPNNLPAQLSAFIGRDREVAEVRVLVESARLVTLAGAGGCGKTRLGLQVAAGLLDGSGDGVLAGGAGRGHRTCRAQEAHRIARPAGGRGREPMPDGPAEPPGPLSGRRAGPGRWSWRQRRAPGSGRVPGMAVGPLGLDNRGTGPFGIVLGAARLRGWREGMPRSWRSGPPRDGPGCCGSYGPGPA